jgi:hypothetical protein
MMTGEAFAGWAIKDDDPKGQEYINNAVVHWLEIKEGFRIASGSCPVAMRASSKAPCRRWNPNQRQVHSVVLKRLLIMIHWCPIITQRVTTG